MIGSVCRCRHGKLGVVYRVKNRGTADVTYVGTGFDGQHWQSKDPEKVADNLYEYIKIKQQTA